MKEKVKDILTGEALKSLARTDNLLVVLNVVMLVGVIATIYGAYWQGKYAKYNYEKDTHGR
jgi:hypothetical protein